MFDLIDRSGNSQHLSFPEILARAPQTLLYFYPKDQTPGCTLEAQDFTRLRANFEAGWIQIIGVSMDDASSHEAFIVSCSLWIDLIADSEQILINQFGVIGTKMLYGKKIHGLIRSTFLLDQSGQILREWRNVRAKGHAEKVARELAILPR